MALIKNIQFQNTLFELCHFLNEFSLNKLEQKMLDVKIKDVVMNGDDINEKNNLSMFEDVQGKKGIYIFYNKKGKILYIGKGGTGSSNEEQHDLRDRIGQELRLYHKDKHSSGTLSKNVIIKGNYKRKPYKYNKDISYYDENKKFKKFIKDWSIKIISFNKDDDIPINLIEAFLIRAYKPIYNIDQ